MADVGRALSADTSANNVADASGAAVFRLFMLRNVVARFWQAPKTTANDVGPFVSQGRDSVAFVLESHATSQHVGARGD